jgi:hypothetical protein
MKPTCGGQKGNGDLCQATPMRGSGLCFWHDPDYAAEAKEAQRIGGLRHRTEATVAAAYNFEGLRTIDQIWRFIEMAAIDTLRLDNGVNRNRTMGSLAQLGMKLLGIGEHEDRIRAIESVLGTRLDRGKRR